MEYRELITTGPTVLGQISQTRTIHSTILNLKATSCVGKLRTFQHCAFYVDYT